MVNLVKLLDLLAKSGLWAGLNWQNWQNWQNCENSDISDVKNSDISDVKNSDISDLTETSLRPHCALLDLTEPYRTRLWTTPDPFMDHTGPVYGKLWKTVILAIFPKTVKNSDFSHFP